MKVFYGVSIIFHTQEVDGQLIVDDGIQQSSV
jgi:hypothetical protein